MLLLYFQYIDRQNCMNQWRIALLYIRSEFQHFVCVNAFKWNQLIVYYIFIYIGHHILWCFWWSRIDWNFVPNALLLNIYIFSLSWEYCNNRNILSRKCGVNVNINKRHARWLQLLILTNIYQTTKKLPEFRIVFKAKFWLSICATLFATISSYI